MGRKANLGCQIWNKKLANKVLRGDPRCSNLGKKGVSGKNINNI